MRQRRASLVYLHFQKQTARLKGELGCLLLLGLGDDLLSHGYDRTIIGATSFHGPVRDGKGWVQRAMVAKNLVVVRLAYAARPTAWGGRSKELIRLLRACL